MDTDSFINALQRFISRRGKPNTIMSDCGSNFKGAVKELKLEHRNLSQMKITESTERQHIVWKFNPPSSPHMDNSWETLLRGVKTSPYNIVKDTDRFSDNYCLYRGREYGEQATNNC